MNIAPYVDLIAIGGDLQLESLSGNIYSHFPGSLQSIGGSLNLYRNLTISRSGNYHKYLIFTTYDFNCSSHVVLDDIAPSSESQHSRLLIESNFQNAIYSCMFFFQMSKYD